MGSPITPAVDDFWTGSLTEYEWSNLVDGKRINLLTLRNEDSECRHRKGLKLEG